MKVKVFQCITMAVSLNTIQPKNHTKSSGTVIIGKRHKDRDEDYGSVMIDELTFWDGQILPEEIQAIATM